MLEFIINNIYFIVAAIAAVIACIWLARRGQVAKIKEIILALCVDAELTYGSGTGQIKKSSVLEALYSLLPSWAKLLFPISELEHYIEEGKQHMDALAESNEKVNALLAGMKPVAASNVKTILKSSIK